MSRAVMKIDHNNNKFSERFAEACGTSEPAEIQRLLKIPYQSAKNYLHGRLPSTEKLIAIAKKTNCSIHWLLTGEGKKIVDTPLAAGTPPPTGEMEAFVRRICVEVFNELGVDKQPAQPRIVVLQSSELMSEKVTETTAALTERKA